MESFVYCEVTSDGPIDRSETTLEYSAPSARKFAPTIRSIDLCRTFGYDAGRDLQARAGGGLAF